MITPQFDIEETSFRSAKYLGSDRRPITNDMRHLVLAQQFYPHKNGLGFYCCYGGLHNPLTQPKDVKTGLVCFQTATPAQLDHIIPKRFGGEDDVFNYQYLSKVYNQRSFKGAKPTFHAAFQAARSGWTLESIDFYDLVENFLLEWKKKHTLSCAWPWHSRCIETGAPILWGFDAKTLSFYSDGFDEELKVKAWCVLQYIEHAPNRSRALRVRDIWEAQYGFPVDR